MSLSSGTFQYRRFVFDAFEALSNATAESNVTKHPPKEGGILSGVGPLGTPILTLLVQIMLIQLLSRLIAVPCKWIKQPTVIAEILAGIILGPTVMGYIPGFSSALFYPAALAGLDLFSGFGLILFLFIMGLELDLKLLKKEILVTAAIAIGGMLLPFALSLPVGVFMYSQFLGNLTPSNVTVYITNSTEPVKNVDLFTFLLFIGVATCITAFPVLARILAELKMLATPLGVTVLGAAAVNDAAAWILLALVIAIANAGNPLNILYIFLMLLGFVLFMGSFVRYGLIFLLKQKWMMDNNNILSLLGLVIILMMCLGASWFTGFIGVHTIFGAFVAGIIVPRKNGVNCQIIEKIEDIIVIIFLPLYFAFSGLRTDLTKLSSGVAWLCVLLIIVAATAGKIIASFTIAMACGTKKVRDALTIGILMNCKGLVELIILNVGLDAGILDTTIFSIMVLLAVFTTFMTTPLAWLCFTRRQKPKSAKFELPSSRSNVFNPLICALSPTHVPLQLGLVQMLLQSQPTVSTFHVFRMLEITMRESSIATAMVADEEKGLKDPTGLALNKFSRRHHLICLRHFKFGSLFDLPENIKLVAQENSLNLILVPFLDTNNINVEENDWRTTDAALLELFNTSPTDICLLIDHGASVITDRMNILLIYEDRNLDSQLALKFVLSLLKSSTVVVTIVHKMAAIPDEQLPRFEASRHSLHRFRESTAYISKMFESPHLLPMEQAQLDKEDITLEKSMETSPEKSKQEQKAKIVFEKNIAEIERLETMLWDREQDSETIETRLREELQSISDRVSYLQYYPIPGNLLNSRFFENDVYVFSLVVSGRGSVDDRSGKHTLHDLVGETAFELLSAEVGSGQLVFSCGVKEVITADNTESKIDSNRPGSIHETDHDVAHEIEMHPTVAPINVVVSSIGDESNDL